MPFFHVLMKCKYSTNFALKCSRLETLFLFQRNFQEKRGSEDVSIISCPKLRFYPGYLCSLKEPIGKWEFFVSECEGISSFVDEYMFLNIHAEPGKFIA